MNRPYGVHYGGGHLGGLRGCDFQDVGGAVVFDDLIRVPGAADDAVLVGLEPFDEIVSEGAVLVGERGAAQAFNGFKGDPGVRVLFHGCPPVRQSEETQVVFGILAALFVTSQDTHVLYIR